MMENKSDVMEWLLEGDPSITWQVHRDLLDEPQEVYENTRLRVALEGWGAQFLTFQDPEGTWGEGLYSPKWVSTTYTMLTLRRLGLPPEHPKAIMGCQQLLDGGFYEDQGINFSTRSKHSETCITGMVLSLLAYFRYPDDRVHEVVEHLLRQQMADDGWNCRSYRGDTHSSFHTTISVLEGLHEYENVYPEYANTVRDAQARAREFLLQHRLYHSHRTGEIVHHSMVKIPFPPRWHYDFLRSLDYFQASDAPADDRLVDAIDLLQSKQRKDGTWVVNSGYSGLTYFQMEKAGKPSRMNTLRALRVLKWWEEQGI